MIEELNQASLFDMFSASAESYAEAKKKNSDESGLKTKHFRIDADGTKRLRVLPLAPVLDSEGKPLPMDRKGYEYPVKSNFLQITDSKNKKIYVNVCHLKYAFPDAPEDLIDAYVRVASEKYANDPDLVKKITSNSFEGGLKWSSQRAMYILDTDKREEGIQLFSVSYAQYREIEERKLKIWEKLNAAKGQTECPISSVSNAFPLEITRKTENKKVSYSFNIDTIGGPDQLSVEELKTLLDTPRIPDVLYRYSRYALEATIVFLQQYDAKLDIHVMNDPQIQDCIAQIKTILPSDDTSHFTMNGVAAAETNNEDALTKLWAEHDRLESEGLGKGTDAYRDLRSSIQDYIEDNDLDIRVSHKRTNLELLEEIEELVNNGTLPESNDEEAPADEPEAPAVDDEPEDEPEAPEESDDEEDEEDEEEPQVPQPRPARSARPARIRR